MAKIKLFFHLLKLDIRENKADWLARLVFFLGPLLSYSAVEILNGNKPFGSIEAWRVLWNFVWYWVIYGLFWLLTGRRKRAGAVAAALFCFVFGLVNHYILRFRGTMFFPIDILSWKTALNVSAGYDYSPDKAVWLAFALTAVYVLVWLLAFRKRLGRRPQSRSFTALAAGGLAVFLLVFFSAGFLPSINLYAEQWVTQRNGFVFNFMLSLRYSFAQEPEGYSLEQVEDILAEYTGREDGGEDTTPELPDNIIVIMNESLGDLSIYENYSVSRDPLSYLHRMKDNTISGWLYSPVFGGGTANVEYEVLTGNPSHFLPDGTVAYQMYVDSATPSLATLAGEQGYTSYAFHPYLASGWNRVQVYGYLGFDNQLFDRDVTEPEYVRKYISDACDFAVLEDITEENEGRCFIFNVTMQNHSGYQQGWNNLPYTVQLTGELEGASTSAEQYLCLVDLTDEAFRDLIEYYKASDETTLIVMFGDHQPPLTNEFYDKLMGSTAAQRSSRENLEKYKTPFVIWANYDIPEMTGMELSANYLGLLVSDVAGLPRSDYMELVADVMEELPVIHDLGYITGDGRYVESFDDLSPEQQELLYRYELIAYYNQFDRDEDEEDFFRGG